MRVLVATTESQGTADDDYSWTIEGELVYVPVLDCDCPGCGCRYGFAGMASSKATTTAKVVDRPDLTLPDFTAAVSDALDRGGWLEWLEPDEVEELVADRVGLLMAISESAALGGLVRRDGGQILVKGQG